MNAPDREVTVAGIGISAVGGTHGMLARAGYRALSMRRIVICRASISSITPSAGLIAYTVAPSAATARDQSRYFSKSPDRCSTGSAMVAARRDTRSSARTYGGIPFAMHVGPSVDVQLVVALPASRLNIQRPSGETIPGVRKPF